jgi:hypothetical protein
MRAPTRPHPASSRHRSARAPRVCVEEGGVAWAILAEDQKVVWSLCFRAKTPGGLRGRFYAQRVAPLMREYRPSRPSDVDMTAKPGYLQSHCGPASRSVPRTRPPSTSRGGSGGGGKAAAYRAAGLAAASRRTRRAVGGGDRVAWRYGLGGFSGLVPPAQVPWPASPGDPWLWGVCTMLSIGPCPRVMSFSPL